MHQKPCPAPNKVAVDFFCPLAKGGPLGAVFIARCTPYMGAHMRAQKSKVREASLVEGVQTKTSERFNRVPANYAITYI